MFEINVFDKIAEMRNDRGADVEAGAAATVPPRTTLC